MTVATTAQDPGPGNDEPPAPPEPLRVGVLGAARIAELAIVKPARATGTRLVAIAARDRARAAAYAAEHGVEQALASYADVIAAPDVEAVYNPLPNALHGRWNLAAIDAGKHVLSEKPFAANAEEAAEVAAAAQGSGVVVVEGFHYLYHPVTRRLHELLASGDLGELVHVETILEIQDPGPRDPRWSLDLAGGATMDLGCYSLHAQRVLAPWGGGEPELVAARAGERAGAPGVDEWLEARLRFPSGATGVARCHMAGDHRQMTCRVIGTRGEALVPNFVEPHLDDRLIIRTPGGERVEHHGTRSSYTFQLAAFSRAVREGASLPMNVDDAVANMRLIDACYVAAGLQPRPRMQKASVPPARPRTPPPTNCSAGIRRPS
ncbi:MAG: oxidoreductase [Frankiales bacterium]|nr:oxidoreductase [Frankiales bacterium]